MLEYSREDAAEDMDLHDVTEKAIALGKERGILQMDDYAEIVGDAEDAPKGEMKEMDYGSVLMRNLMPGANDLEQYVDILIMDPKIASSSTEQEFRSLLRDKVEKANFFGSKDKVSQAAERILAFGNNAGKYSDTITRVFNMIKGKSVNEAVNLKQAKLSSAEYQKAKKLKDFKASDWKWNASEDLYTKVVNEAELSEAYVPSNIKEFAKRKGISSLVNKVAGWAEKAGKGIRGGTAIGKDYSTLVLDMTYQGGEIRINTDNDTITLYDEPVDNFNAFQRVYIDGQDLEENVAPNHDGKSAPYG
jgi:hypothetical protein